MTTPSPRNHCRLRPSRSPTRPQLAGTVEGESRKSAVEGERMICMDGEGVQPALYQPENERQGNVVGLDPFPVEEQMEHEDDALYPHIEARIRNCDSACMRMEQMICWICKEQGQLGNQIMGQWGSSKSLDHRVGWLVCDMQEYRGALVHMRADHAAATQSEILFWQLL